MAGKIDRNARNKLRYLIGIDPGTNTGMVVFDRIAGKMVFWKKGDFWSVYDCILENYTPEVARIVIEDPNQINPTWARNMKKPGSNPKRMQKISQDVGMNKREAKLLFNRFKALGWKVEKHSPAGLGPKWKYPHFARQMKITDPAWAKKLAQDNHEHVRDAARILQKAL